MSLRQETQESYVRPLDLQVDIDQTDYDELKEYGGSEVRDIAGTEAVDLYSGDDWTDAELTARAINLDDGAYILSVTEHQADSYTDLEELGPVEDILEGKGLP
ncbi:MAG: hypothetical protein H8Z69_03730 [Nanohaloarchaea archaeon]|nr:hypothetical protein [Candidatus Nanohaloarchaea archaeon]